jgi:predicted nucleotidyltransferase
MTPSTPTLPTRQQLIDRLSQHKQEWRRLYGIQAITLFGSIARGEGTDASDLDLCVILDPPNPLALVHFRDAVQDLAGRRVDVVTRWPGMNPALQQEIERDAVSI